MAIKCILLWALVAVLIITLLQSHKVNGEFTDRKILVSKFGDRTITLLQLEKVRKSLRNEFIKNLRSLPSKIKSDLVKIAKMAFNNEKYPKKTATAYLEFFRTGNRASYEKLVTDHQRRIAALVVGHLLDQMNNRSSTQYVDEIVDGVWSLMEESTWCWPAHLNGLQNSPGDHLAAPEHLAFDLGTGETAKFVSWVKLLMAKKLDQVSTVVNRRIDYELRERIFNDFLNRNYGWVGVGTHQVNNWNIWINSNILKSEILTLNNITLFKEVFNRTIHSTDHFINSFGNDGGWAEGPDYWRQAGARLIEFLKLLGNLFPDAKKYFRKVKLLKSIGQYSYKLHIKDNRFVNFADSSSMITFPPSLIVMYGTMFNDKSMKQFSAFMWRLVAKDGVSDYLNRTLPDLNEFINIVNLRTEITKAKAIAPEPELVWLPDLQVLVTRSNKKVWADDSKFLLAAKAGTNHESHNHNDVGSFVLYLSGNPVIIDIGVGTYTDKTFGEGRYEIFYFRSVFHNTPTINGIEQKAGDEYTSRDVSLKELPNKGGVVFTANIAGAYPTESQAKHWTRTITFNQTANSVTLEEQFELTTFVAPQKLHFILVKEIKVTETSTGLMLADNVTGVKVAMDFDLKIFSFSVEQKSLDGDQHLTRVWGAQVQRLNLTTVDSFKVLNGHFKISFYKAK